MAKKKKSRSKSGAESSSVADRQANVKPNLNQLDRKTSTSSSKQNESAELPPVRRLPIPFWISVILLVGFLSFLGSICYQITY